MNVRAQMACTWCGLAFVILFVVGWIPLARFVPAPSPALDPEAIAAIYQANTGAIRFGILLAMFGVGFTIPWIAVVAIQMRRIEGASPLFTYAQLVGGAVTVCIFTTVTVLWTVAAFRPERSPELIQLVNDIAWIMALMTFPPFFMQFVAIGLATFSDRSDPPVFPRWVGYFNVWVAILAMPGGLLTFFKRGPFAWNGLLAFWVPVGVFLLWYLVMFWALRRAIRQEAT